MKQRITFFFLVALAASLAHFLIVLVLTQVVISGGAFWPLVPVLWVFIAPMNFLLSSSFGHTLSPILSQLLFIANSFLWGSAVGAIVLSRRRYE